MSRGTVVGYLVVVAAAAACGVWLALDRLSGPASLIVAASVLVAAGSAHVGFTGRRRGARALAVARESEHRCAAMFDTSPIPLALVRMPRGSVVEANGALLRLFGHGRDEILGRTIVELGITPSPAYAAISWELHRGGSVRDFECERRTDGGVQTLAISMRQVTLSGGRCAMLAVRDITDQRRLENALRESEQRLALAGLVED